MDEESHSQCFFNEGQVNNVTIVKESRDLSL